MLNCVIEDKFDRFIYDNDNIEDEFYANFNDVFHVFIRRIAYLYFKLGLGHKFRPFNNIFYKQYLVSGY